MSELTSRRQQILQFIRDFIEEKGYSPTVRDIAKGCGIKSPAAVQYHLDILKQEGYIHREPQVFRSIGLMGEKGKGIALVPLLGTIAAGNPIPVPTSDTWTAIPEETLRLPEDLTRGKDNIFALKVKGTSMIDALIDDGDIVLMQEAKTVDNGDMAAVWLKEQQEVSLKKVYRERNCVRLQPANRQMKPLYQDPDNVEIQGKLIGVIRKLR